MVDPPQPLVHFSDERDQMVIQDVRLCGEENKIESSQTLPSLRISPRESLKIVRAMIKRPIALLKDDFFEVTKVLRPQGPSTLQVVDFCEHF